MSLYAQAFISGVSALSGAEADAAYTTAYNITAQSEAQKANLKNAIHTANLNIGSIKQDKILTNVDIQSKRDNAAAMAKVNAAVAGVSGGSVDDVMYDINRNEAFALNRANRQAESATESQLAQIGSQTSALLTVNDDLPKIDTVGELLSAFSSFELSDLKINEALTNNPETSGGTGESITDGELWSK